ncbi:MAG: phosphorylase, partial [Burkholderiales bacterium]|nr:phosphorylase [Burkholderiales bacterium]
MIGIGAFVTDFLSRLLPAHAGDRGEPLWAELFSAERLEQHGDSLAKAQTAVLARGRWYPFALRNRDNQQKLIASYQAINEAVKQKRAITPAADWLLNNFHVIEEQVRDIHTLLPRAFYRQLPKLVGGPLNGLPRVYGVAWAFVAHTDSRFDPDMLLRFARAYQNVQPLTIGELWALPIMLRIVMVENLRRLAMRIVASMNGRAEADRYADQLLGLQRSGEGAVAVAPADQVRSLSDAYVVQLLQRLRYPDANAAPVLQWLNDRLAKQNTGAEQIVQRELNLQAAANVSVRNLITSMRLVSAFDWDDFFESASPVNAVLSRYAGFMEMDFATRDAYRHAIETLARRSPLDEIQVAQAAVADAAAYRGKDGRIDERRKDPGFYLIDGGRLEFEKQIGFVPRPTRRLLRNLQHLALPVYLGVLAATAFAVWWLVVDSGNAMALAPIEWALLAALAVLPASDIALTLVNRFVTELVRPRHLPRLALKQGIPASLSTIVVVPTFLTDQASIDEQMYRLETRYLANAAGEVYFALLTDWRDAALEELPNDRELLLAAAASVKELNRRYGPAPSGSNRFFLFHRRRLWNASEGVWMGWERKRGKLHELNSLLRGATDTSFIHDSGCFVPPPANVRFVLTLDTDTILPMGTVAELVGAFGHPLNRPRFNAADLVVEGYGIMQPRVTPALPSRLSSSPYQRLFSGRCGVDPYTFQVSDVYQDLFQQGTFTGKGLYEVDTFERALAGRVPPNAVLSHDLFESIFARCAFVSDIELFEEFPPHTEAVSARAHRWARGDWQLLPWIVGLRGRGIPALGRWKMADNLRRSLQAPCTVALLVASWLIAAAPRG